MKMLLTVPEPNGDHIAILHPIPDDPGGITAWGLSLPYLTGDDKERALRLATDAGWSVAAGSEWTLNAETEPDRWEITIELQNTAKA